jgi:hypothetical protein
MPKPEQYRFAGERDGSPFISWLQYRLREIRIRENKFSLSWEETLHPSPCIQEASLHQGSGINVHMRYWLFNLTHTHELASTELARVKQAFDAVGLQEPSDYTIDRHVNGFMVTVPLPNPPELLDQRVLKDLQRLRLQYYVRVAEKILHQYMDSDITAHSPSERGQALRTLRSYLHSTARQKIDRPHAAGLHHASALADLPFGVMAEKAMQLFAEAIAFSVPRDDIAQAFSTMDEMLVDYAMLHGIAMNSSWSGKPFRFNAT